MEWEVQLIEWMQHGLGGFGSLLGKVFSFIGGEMGLLLVALILLFCWRKEVGYRLALMVAAVNTWLPMIKAAVLRPRPYMEYPGRVEGREAVDAGASMDDVAAQGYSFPSTHAASAAALYLPLGKAAKKSWMWIVCILITLLVGVARVIAGMHYPTDVLAGWALGLAAIGIFLLLEKTVKKEWIRHLIILVSVLPGVIFVRTQDYYTSLGMVIGVVAAIPFERKYVGFRDTKNIAAMILRPLCAFGIYFILNTLLKLPFDKAFLESASLGAFLIRTARYAVIVFVMLGVYPKLFPLFEKIGKKGNA